MKKLGVVMFLAIVMSMAAYAKEWDGTVVGNVVERHHGDSISIYIVNDAAEWRVIEPGRISEHVGQKVKATCHFRDEDGVKTAKVIEFNVLDKEEPGREGTIIGKVVESKETGKIFIHNESASYEVIEPGRIAEHVGKRVRATGFIREEHGRKTIKVREFKVLD